MDTGGLGLCANLTMPGDASAGAFAGGDTKAQMPLRSDEISRILGRLSNLLKEVIARISGDEQSRFCSFDGRGNSLSHPDWGQFIGHGITGVKNRGGEPANIGVPGNIVGQGCLG